VIANANGIDNPLQPPVGQRDDSDFLTSKTSLNAFTSWLNPIRISRCCRCSRSRSTARR
jgi:hypothetical protein